MSPSNDKDLMNKKAVALSYDEDINAAPIIVASGSGYMAEKIINTARESGVPVYEDNSLATVLSQLSLGSEIPEQLYQAIVDIYVYFLKFSTKGRENQETNADGNEAGGSAAATGGSSAGSESEAAGDSGSGGNERNGAAGGNNAPENFGEAKAPDGMSG